MFFTSLFNFLVCFFGSNAIWNMHEVMNFQFVCFDNSFFSPNLFLITRHLCFLPPSVCCCALKLQCPRGFPNLLKYFCFCINCMVRGFDVVGWPGVGSSSTDSGSGQPVSILPLVFPACGHLVSFRKASFEPRCSEAGFGSSGFWAPKCMFHNERISAGIQKQNSVDRGAVPIRVPWSPRHPTPHEIRHFRSKFFKHDTQEIRY